MHNDEVWTHHYGAFRLPSLCIGRRLTMSVDASLLWDYPRYAHKIMVHSDFIAVHRSTSSDASRSQQLCALWMFVRITRVVPQKTSTDRRRPMQNDGSLNAPLSLCIGWRWTSTDAQRGQVLLLWHRSAMKGDIERCRKASADVQWWKYERTISRHLYWNDVTLMVHSDFIAAHRSTNICVLQRGWPRAKGRVGKCRLMQNNRSLNAQHNYIYISEPPFLTWKL